MVFWDFADSAVAFCVFCVGIVHVTGAEAVELEAKGDDPQEYKHSSILVTPQVKGNQ